MKVIEPVETMQLICKRLISDQAKTIRLIPTMGSLHAGHASLIKRAIEDKAEPEANGCCCASSSSSSTTTFAASAPATQVSGDDNDQSAQASQLENNLSRPSKRRPVIVVSVFVNPLQFNDRDDFVKYPISTGQDLALCEQLGVDYVFMPKRRDLLNEPSGACISRKISVASMASSVQSQTCASDCVTIKPPEGLAQDLEGRSRQNHFEGMLTIVCKLLNIVQPDRAYFGEKDYQQLILVDKMVHDLNIGTKICPVETVREPGTSLPLSSRNSRLSSEQKQVAANLMFGALLGGKSSLELKCRRSTYDDSNAGPAPNFDLEMILMASQIAAQSCSQLTPTTSNDEETVGVEYFELRCAKDLTVIDFDQEINLYDCQRGCVKERVLSSSPMDSMQGQLVNEDAKVLEARLLISVLVAKVRLLDNMAVRLNL